MEATKLHRRVAYVMAVVCFVVALALATLGYTPDQIQNLFPAVVLASIAFLALASLRARPALLLTVGVAGALLSPMLWSALPALLVPSLVCVYAFARSPRPRPRPIGTTVGVVLLPLVLLAAGVVVFLDGDTRQVCESSRGGTVCSETVATSAIVRASALAIGGAASGFLAATPTRRARARASPGTR